VEIEAQWPVKLVQSAPKFQVSERKTERHTQKPYQENKPTTLLSLTHCMLWWRYSFSFSGRGSLNLAHFHFSALFTI